MPPDSYISIELGGSTALGRIVVNGGVTVSGALTLTLPPELRNNEATYAIIAAASLSGKFHSVSETTQQVTHNINHVGRSRKTCAHFAITGIVVGAAIAIGALTSIYMF